MTTLKTEHVLYMFHDIHEAYACVTMGPVEALTLLLYSYPLLEYVMECSIFMNKISYPTLSIHVAHYLSASRCRTRVRS